MAVPAATQRWVSWRATAVALVALCGFLLVGGPVAAQATGGLVIQVRDANGDLPGASVTLSSVERKIKTHTKPTDARGRAAFPVLPAGGGYVVEVGFPGYGTVRLDDLTVRIGQTPTMSIELSESYTEQVQVSAERPVIDLEKSSTSTRFTSDFIRDLPVAGRFYQNILTFAPGVQDPNGDGNPNVHGSRARDFKAVVNGVSNVDPLTGQFRANINPNSIDEIEIITAGAGPELGRAQGGFANIVQKQGSNRFEGVFDFIHRSSTFDGDGAASLSPGRTPSFDWIQPSLQVSGPIVKDRLWYRLSHEWIDRDDPVNTGAALEIVTQKQQINSDQITWQVSDRNKLAFKYDANPLEITNFGVSSLTPPTASQLREFGADTYSVVWSAPYSPQFFVESVVAWQDGGQGIHPAQRGVPNNCVGGPPIIEGAQCSNLEDGTTSGSYWLDFEDFRERFTVKSDATFYAKRKFLGMTHQVRVGFIIENERYVREIFQRPRFVFEIFRPPFSGSLVDLEPIAIVNASISVPEGQRARATGTTWGLYVKDQMKPAQNLTIELGGRLEREVIDSQGHSPVDPVAEFELYNSLLDQGARPHEARVQAFTAYEGVVAVKRQLAQIFELPPSRFNSFFGPVIGQSAFQTKFRRLENVQIVNLNFSPFLAVSWDPGNNGKTKLAFTAGRHHNNIPLLIPLLELVPPTLSFDFLPSRKGGRWVLEDLRSIRGSVNPAASLRVVDRDLETPYQDELTLTFQRELWAETSIILTYVKRLYRQQFQDVDINNVPGDYGTCVYARQAGDPTLDTSGGPDGELDDCTGLFEFAGLRQVPGGGAVPTFLGRPDGRPDLYTMNPFWGPIYELGNYNRADYEGVVLELVRRQYRGWELQSSYTWSIARGDGEDFAQFLGNDQSLLEDERGFQSNDQRHVVKLVAATVTPWGIRLGGSATWQSGLPYSVLAQRIGWFSKPPALAGFGSSESTVRQLYTSGVRNDRRNRSYWNFDIKATRELLLRGGMSLQLSAEIFNLLNDGTYIIYNPFFETGYQLNGNNDAYRRFGRRFQLGMRLSF